MKRQILAFSLCVVLAAPMAQAEPDAPDSTAPMPQWSAWGGTIGLRLNPDTLGDLGIRVQSRSQMLQKNAARLTDGLNVRQAQIAEFFDLRRTGSIEFRAERGSFAGFLGGSLQARGGFVLSLANGETIDLTDFRLRGNAQDPMLLDVLDSAGNRWFYIQRLMYDIVDNNRILAIYAADMSASPELAERVGNPALAGHPIGGVELLTQVQSQGMGGVRDIAATTHWPGEQVDGQPSGTVYQADLFMQFFDVVRMRQSGTSGHGGNGRVVFAPNSTLRNNVNNGSAAVTVPGQGALGTSSALWTARIPWYGKFSGNFAPYSNDQHPYLIWNMYRINADGGIEQIARSGVKHAWLTTNLGCAAGENINNNILGRSCSDTYSTYNNDDNQDLSHRSEIIPATGEWGRCGSLFDPNCTGNNTNANPSDDEYVRRLVVNESQISNTVNAGGRYLFDSWYLARQDINIYNSMATVTGVPTYSGNNWSFASQSNYKLGSITDRWVEDLPAGTSAVNTELAVAEGHTKLAVRVTDLGNGQWRYHYAVHNLDFARAVTSGASPNLRVLSNKGFSKFSVPLPAGVSVVSNRFSDGDLVAANDWSFSSAGNALTWSAPTNASLDWGTLFLFSVVLNSPPTAGTGSLSVATAGTPTAFSVASLVPEALINDTIFKHGFE